MNSLRSMYIVGASLVLAGILVPTNWITTRVTPTYRRKYVSAYTGKAISYAYIFTAFLAYSLNNFIYIL